MIEYLDPRAAVSTKAIPYTLAINLAGSNQLTVGMLANGFPDSENFLYLIAEALQAREPGIKVAHYNKGNASITASNEMLDSINNECQALITAYGH
jgi:hypothetical protein